MPPKFDSTKVPEDAKTGQKMQADALAQACAVVGKMIGEHYIDVDFTQENWHEVLRLQLETVAEVLYDYQ